MAIVSNRGGVFLVLASLAVIAAVLAYLSWPSPGRNAGHSVSAPSSAKDSPPLAPPAPGAASPGAPGQPDSSAAVLLPAQRLDALFTQLQQSTATPADLAAFREALASGDPKATIAAIRAFLAGGRDAKTSERFQVGPGGKLEGAPTLRVLLLDLLGQLSMTAGTDDGASVGRAILSAKTSPDEWALALRNIGWHEPASTAYLGSKLRELLTYEPWRSNPTAGYLEAVDVAVFTRDATLVPTLEDAARSPSAQLKRAATVAMDRLSEASPLSVMNFLNANPGEFSDAPFLRADYFSKADLSDPAQVSALEHYLSREDVTLPEKTKLLKVLAAPGSIVTDALLSPPLPQEPGTSRDQALLSTLESWSKARRFPELTPQIDATLAQLRP